jgi:hypothetical protein
MMEMNMLVIASDVMLLGVSLRVRQNPCVSWDSREQYKRAP